MMGAEKHQIQLGCGLMGGLFFWRIFPAKKSSLPTTNNPSLGVGKPVKTPQQNWVVPAEPQSQAKRPSDAQRTSTSSSTGSGQSKDLADLKRVRKDVGGVSTDLSLIVEEHKTSNGGSKGLVRATPSNVMVSGQLGNLRKLKTELSTPKMVAEKLLDATPSRNSVDGTMGNLNKLNTTSLKPKLAAERLLDTTPRRSSGDGTIGMGNIVRKSGHEASPRNKMNPETLKSMGNEQYNKGRYEEALELYKQAISLDSSRASYHSNMAAALISLGRLVEAVSKCLEALRIEPDYHRAHDRLATLYLRLGVPEKAMQHAKYSDPDAESLYTETAHSIQTRLKKCIQARNVQDWTTVLNKTHFTISSGADAAPQIYALRAEALLKIHKHQEADDLMKTTLCTNFKSCTEILGLETCAYLYTTEAQIHMAMGRLEDALAAADNASQLDPESLEVRLVSRRTRSVSEARKRGNQLFNASQFSKALCAYGEGLDNDPYNSLLLCNRAACRSKLGQFEKAIEDCNAALMVRPLYSKARLRRADCNAKLERWEAAIQDYEMLIRDAPGDEEVGKSLFDAQVQLMRQRGEDTTGMKFGSNLVQVTSNERFRHYVTLPGMAVVLFCNNNCSKQVLQILDQVCSRFPSVSFLKVEIEDHPYLAKSEEVGSSIPIFRIYKNGSKVKDVAANSGELLENAVKLHSKRL